MDSRIDKFLERRLWIHCERYFWGIIFLREMIRAPIRVCTQRFLSVTRAVKWRVEGRDRQTRGEEIDSGETMWKGEREGERESGITFSISGRAELSSDLSRCHSCWLSNLFGTEAFSPRFTSFPIPLYGESRERNNKAASLSDIALMHALPALSLSFSLYALYIYLLLFLNLRLNRRRLPFRIRGPPTALFFANISVGV